MDLRQWIAMMEFSGAAAFAVRDGRLLCCSPAAELLGLREGGSTAGLFPALWPEEAARLADGCAVTLAGRAWTLRTMAQPEHTLCVLRDASATLPPPNENTLRRASVQLRDAVRDLTAALNAMIDLPVMEDPACVKHAAELLRSAYRIRRTAGEQTLYSLLRGGDYLLSRRKQALVARTAELCGLCADVLRSGGHSLIWTLPEREFPGCIDWNLTALMLCELIDNAVLYGDEAVRLDMTRPALDRVCFAVSNHCAEGVQPAAFFHRHTTALSDTDRQAGMGLDLVAAAAALHGGSLLLSDDGRGRITALLSLQLGEREDPKMESSFQLPRGVDAVMISLSPTLPPEAFFPIDLL